MATRSSPSPAPSFDVAAPRPAATWINGWRFVDGKLWSASGSSNSGLRSDAQLIGYQGDAAKPTAILLKHNGLHFEIQVDASTPVGQTDAAGVKDVLMEAALTTIMDCEDSVAAVDADDKVVIYRNWLGLMKGDLFRKKSPRVARPYPHHERRPRLHRCRRQGSDPCTVVRCCSCVTLAT